MNIHRMEIRAYFYIVVELILICMVICMVIDIIYLVKRNAKIIKISVRSYLLIYK